MEWNQITYMFFSPTWLYLEGFSWFKYGGAKAIWSRGTRLFAGWMGRSDSEAQEGEKRRPALQRMDLTPEEVDLHDDLWLNDMSILYVLFLVSFWIHQREPTRGNDF